VVWAGSAGFRAKGCIGSGTIDGLHRGSIDLDGKRSERRMLDVGHICLPLQSGYKFSDIIDPPCF
jgi:hypothetical protein